MAVAHAKPGEPISVRPLGPVFAGAKTTTLIKSEAVEVIRLVVPAGKEIPTHKTRGEITVQCLEGRIAFTSAGGTHNLEAGDLLYLSAGEEHSLRGLADASLLVTILLR